MNGSQFDMFGIIFTGGVYEIFQQEKVTRASLNNSQEPVSELQLSTARIRFLVTEKGGESLIILRVRSNGGRRRYEFVKCRYRGWKGGDKRRIHRQVGEM